MGIAERQAKERQRRIDMILDAASQVIMDKGIERATMDEIASAAELGKATIYNYFVSKQLLLLGLDLRGTKKEEEGFRRAYEEGRNGLDRALRIGHFYFDHAMESPVCFQAKVQLGRMDVEAFTPLSDNPMVNEYMQAVQRIHQVLADAIADGIDDGTIRANIHPQKMSLLLWCQSNGVIELIQNRGELVATVQGITVEQIRDGFFRAMESQLAATTLNQ
ncbi:TetR/AcrR family transcriptional regulator [bacterium]|nr:TetR/AcrR family transcriptional regulator [bacterium]